MARVGAGTAAGSLVCRVAGDGDGDGEVDGVGRGVGEGRVVVVGRGAGVDCEPLRDALPV